jgi:uncharacterized coiled-coil DUF342 family protein
MVTQAQIEAAWSAFLATDGEMLDALKNALEAAAKAAPPLPEEIAELIEWLNAAKSLFPVHGVEFDKIAIILRTLAQEIERLKVILENHGVTQLEKTRIMLAQKECIRELEAERDEWKARGDRLEAERDNFRGDVERAIGHAAKFAQQANAMKNERDAIRAKTFEECLALIPGGN